MTKVFNPNIGKPDPRIVNCHFIGYLDKSGGAWYAEKLTLRRSEYMFPLQRIRSQFFSIPIAAALTMFLDTIVTTAVVSSPVGIANKNHEPVLQKPVETVVTY